MAALEFFRHELSWVHAEYLNPEHCGYCVVCAAFVILGKRYIGVTIRKRNAMQESVLPLSRRKGFVRPHLTKLAAVYRISDVMLIVGCLVVSAHVYAVSWSDRYSFSAAAAVAVFYLFAESKGLYRSWRISTIFQEWRELWVAWSGTVLALMIVVFIFKDSDEYSRQVILTWLVMTPLVISIWRSLGRVVWREVRRRGGNFRVVAIVGVTDIGARLERNMEAAKWMGLRVKGYYDDRCVSGERIKDNERRAPVVGDNAVLLRHAQRGEIDMIYITFPLRAEQRVCELVRCLSDTTASVYFVPDFEVFDMLSGRWYALGDMPIVSIHETPFAGVEGWVKRVEDVVLSGAILALIAIPMILIAIGVKLSSRGPVLFKQKRYGIDGKEIEVWKFRTMKVCEDGQAVVQARQCDPRVTPFGAFLRRTSLDELPQLINVIQGVMSLVGPRPHAVAHNEEYRKLVYRYMLRHKVKPGITGLAQVNGWRGETDTLDKMERRIQYDLEYIRHWSLGLDFRIIFLTLFKGFVNKNAY